MSTRVLVALHLVARFKRLLRGGGQLQVAGMLLGAVHNHDTLVLGLLYGERNAEATRRQQDRAGVVLRVFGQQVRCVFGPLRETDQGDFRAVDLGLLFQILERRCYRFSVGATESSCHMN